MEKCNMPGCRAEANKTWSMVPVCNEHYQALKLETEQFYKGTGQFKISYDERNYYFAIKHLIPFKVKEKK